MSILALALRYWRFLAGAAALLAILIYVRHYGAQEYEAGYEKARTEYAHAIERQKIDNARREEAGRVRVAAIQDSSDRALRDLQARSDAALRAVALRVRVNASAGRACVSESARSAPLSHDPATDRGPAGGNAAPARDIAAELIRFARDDEQMRQALIACQSYVRSIH